MSLVVNLLSFLGAFLAVFAANALLSDVTAGERKREKRRLEEQYRVREREKAKRHTTTELKNFDQIAEEVLAQQKKQTLGEWLVSLCKQSGMQIDVDRLLLFCGAAALVFGALVYLLTASLGATAAVALFGGLIPIGYVHIKRASRLNRLREQLPDAFDLMARVMRSGQTVSQAMQAVSDEFERPISLEFLYCHEQMNLGLTAEAALRDLSRRTGLLEVKIFVLAVVVHRQTGGNLAELLDKLSYIVRERFRIGGMIKSLTAQGRLQGLILLSLPPIMFCVLMILHRDYEMLLLEHPMMIAAALGMMALGAAWIQKIVNFDY